MAEWWQITEDFYRVPNKVSEAKMEGSWTVAELKMIELFQRHTLGWSTDLLNSDHPTRKKAWGERIIASKLQLSRRTVQRTLHSLQERKVIRAEAKHDGRSPTVWRFQDPALWDLRKQASPMTPIGPRKDPGGKDSEDDQQASPMTPVAVGSELTQASPATPVTGVIRDAHYRRHPRRPIERNLEIQAEKEIVDDGLSSNATRGGQTPKPSRPAMDLAENIKALGQFIKELPAASSFSDFKAQEWAEAILMRCSLTLAEAKQLLPPFFAELNRRGVKPGYGWKIIHNGDLRGFLREAPAATDALLGENRFDQPGVSDEDLERLRPVWTAIEQRRAALGRDGIRQRETIVREAFAGAGIEYDPQTHDAQLALLTRQDLIRQAAGGV